MKTFSELYTRAQQIDPSSATFPQASILMLLSDTKSTCEALNDFKYEVVIASNHTDVYDVRVCRDLCVSGLNSAGNKATLDARFQAVKACLYSYAGGL